MIKVILIVYFGGLILSGFIAFSIDPTGIVGPWLIIAWVFPWGPIVTAAIALIYLFLYRTYKRSQPVFHFSGYIDKDGKRVPITIKISNPQRTKETGDWCCELFAPLLFYGTKKIVGVDEAQVRKLAVEFLGSLVGERRLYNHKGEIMSL